MELGYSTNGQRQNCSPKIYRSSSSVAITVVAVLLVVLVAVLLVVPLVVPLAVLLAVLLVVAVPVAAVLPPLVVLAANFLEVVLSQEVVVRCWDQQDLSASFAIRQS